MVHCIFTIQYTTHHTLHIHYMVHYSPYSTLTIRTLLPIHHDRYIGETLGAIEPMDPSKPKLEANTNSTAMYRTNGSVAMGSSRGAAREEVGVLWARLLDGSPSPLTAGVCFEGGVWQAGGRWEQWDADIRQWRPAAWLTIRDESECYR
jgi:hypothetical protein